MENFPDLWQAYGSFQLVLHPYQDHLPHRVLNAVISDPIARGWSLEDFSYEAMKRILAILPRCPHQREDIDRNWSDYKGTPWNNMDTISQCRQLWNHIKRIQLGTWPGTIEFYLIGLSTWSARNATHRPEKVTIWICKPAESEVVRFIGMTDYTIPL